MEGTVAEQTLGEYTYLPIERVHFGSGSLKHLGQELDRLESQRPFVITGKSIREQTDLVSQVEKYTRLTLAGVFSGIRQHAPLTPIMEAVEHAKHARADALISVGGGSPIDSTKIIVKELSSNFSKPIIPHIAIPTTLSAAEFSHSAGMTDEKEKTKKGVRDTRMTPRIVFLDPELTLETPGWLWAASGIRSLDHAVEQILSPKHQPYVDTLALEAIHLLFRNLPLCNKNPDKIEPRLGCQLAAWMSYQGAYSVGTGISHAIGRVIGARYDIPHGITSCITLPEVMRAEARRSPERLVPIAKAEGVELKGKPSPRETAMLAAEKVAALVKELGLEKTLSSYHVPKEDLPRIAREAVGPDKDATDALHILERVY